MITGEQFIHMLAEAGVLRDDDPIRRVVIDAEVGDSCRLYVEMLGDERMLELTQGARGIEMKVIRVQPESDEKDSPIPRATNVGPVIDVTAYDDGVDRGTMIVYKPSSMLCPVCGAVPDQDHSADCPLRDFDRQLARVQEPESEEKPVSS